MPRISIGAVMAVLFVVAMDCVIALAQLDRPADGREVLTGPAGPVPGP